MDRSDDRRRRRRGATRWAATLLAAGVGAGVEQAASAPLCGREAGVWSTRGCAPNCGAGALCVLSPWRSDECAVECLAPASEADPQEWRVALDATRVHRVGHVEVPVNVSQLWFQGGDSATATTEVHFLSGFSHADYLSAMVFIGLDLSASTFPTLPPTLQTLRLVDCVLPPSIFTSLLQLPQLQTLELRGSTTSASLSGLPELSESAFAFLSTRLSTNSTVQSVPPATRCSAGRVGMLDALAVCVAGVEVAVERRLETNVALASDGSDSASGSSSTTNDAMDGASRGSRSAADQDMSTLVLLSMGLPFLYFLYKVGLYIFFMRTYKRDRRASAEQAAMAQTKILDDEEGEMETNRPTGCESTGSSTATPKPRKPRSQQNSSKKPLSGNNAGFWVDEELQAWRLDFQRLKLLKCLTLSPNQKRHTLRKQSVTSALHQREVWLASYALEGGATSASLAASQRSNHGSKSNPLVVVKFLPPREGELASSSSGGSSSVREKLKGELRRQAQFSHPQVATFIGVAWSRETHLVAVSEYLAQGDLRQWLHRSARQEAGRWSVRKVQMLVDVTRALLYLHSMHPRLVHGNCNSRNVLLDDALRAKLSDFGVDGRGVDPLSEQELMSYSAVGSGRWISPEALLGRDTGAAYPDASDVYSLGILMAEVDSHELPFSDLLQANRAAVPETDILQLIAKGALSPTLSSTCPTNVVNLVEACTSYAPKHRPSSKQVLQDLLRILEDLRVKEPQVQTAAVDSPEERPSNFV